MSAACNIEAFYIFMTGLFHIYVQCFAVTFSRVVWINSPYPWLIDINSVHQVGINGWFVMFTKVLTTKLLQVMKPNYKFWKSALKKIEGDFKEASKSK